MLSNQGMGYEKIANTLNKNGVQAPILDKWKGGTVRSILTNPIYMGYIAYNRRKNGHANSTRLDRKEWTYSREQKPEIVIVSQEIWERAQEIREARKNKTMPQDRKQIIYIWSSIMCHFLQGADLHLQAWFIVVTVEND